MHDESGTALKINNLYLIRTATILTINQVVRESKRETDRVKGETGVVKKAKERKKKRER